jgi:dihydroorotate dehydrogenase electron transfer subunit
LQYGDGEASRLIVLFGADDTFPFRPRPSTILVPGMPAGVIASIPALEEVGIASRLASTAGLPGCYDGTVTELAELWLRAVGSNRARITTIVP